MMNNSEVEEAEEKVRLDVSGGEKSFGRSLLVFCRL
jgi:hypothetical protein